MKGFIAKTMASLCVAGGALTTGAGCYEYKDLVDPCYPDRYEFAARQDVKASFAPQVHNGHVLDQTIWNYDFEPGTAILTAGAMDRLAYLARRRPSPDPVIYLQVAQDVTYEPGVPEKFVESRNRLDAKRIQAITEYLTAQTEGRNVAFTVVRHDPAETGISAVPIGASLKMLQTTSQGVLVRPGAGGGGGAAAAH